MVEKTTHYRTCPLCEATCGLEITMLGHEVKRIRGDRADVFSKGFICPKGSTLKQLHDDPDRLRTPMVRRDGQLEPATWAEAWAAIADGLGTVRETHGNNAVGIYLGNPTAHTVAGALFVRPLIQALGTKNVFSASTVDQMPRHVACGYLYGNPGAMPVPDLDRTSYLLMLGANPLESNGSLCTAPDFPGRLAAIRGRGGRVVVVDPRRTATAEVADEHLAIRPGTDAAWLAALAQAIIEHHDAEFGNAEGMVSGLDEVTEALAPFTPDSVAAFCGIDAATTRRIAAELAAAESAAVYGRIGVHTVRHGTLSAWLVDVINIVTGNLDREGGVMFALPVHGRPDVAIEAPVPGRGFATGRWSSRVSQRPEVRGELPTAALAEEIETAGEGQIRALVTTSGNPVRSIQESERIDAAIASLDFMVSIDIYVNETTRHADVILPPPSAIEKAHFDFAFYGLSVRNVVNYSPAVIEPEGPDEWELFAGLATVASGADPTQTSPSVVGDLVVAELASQAVRLSGGPCEGLDPDDLVAEVAMLPYPERIIGLMTRVGPYGLTFDDLAAHPHGIDLGPLQPRLRNALRTASGTVELAAPPLLADLDELAHTVAGHRAPSSSSDELLLVGRRHLRSNNSWMHNVEVLVKGRPRCTLQVHPDDSHRLGLVGGGTARVESAAGSVEATVEVTDVVMPGVVSLPHGWGHDVDGVRLNVARRYAGVNSNALTDATVVDPLSGNGQLNAIPVRVSAVVAGATPQSPDQASISERRISASASG